MRLLGNLLKTLVRKGRLRIYDAGGVAHEFGPGADGPFVTARLHERSVERKLFFNPELHAAEAYMDGTIAIDKSIPVGSPKWHKIKDLTGDGFGFLGCCYEAICQ